MVLWGMPELGSECKMQVACLNQWRLRSVKEGRLIVSLHHKSAQLLNLMVIYAQLFSSCTFVITVL